MAKRPLYFDCDPGVDDALALAYLLNSSEVSLVGIGTICGNVDVEHTTENALRPSPSQAGRTYRSRWGSIAT